MKSTDDISDIALVRLFRNARERMDLPSALRHVIAQAPHVLADAYPPAVLAVGQEVARRFGFRNAEALYGRDEIGREARRLAWWITHMEFNVSFPLIARAYGDRDHSTIIRTLDRWQERLAADPLVPVIVAAVREQFRRKAA